MDTATYQQRRGQIEDYFDRTALKAWEQLTSTAPVGRIRATVRAGRDQMRSTLLQWLPQDMSGQRVLDAGCGTGALAVEVARRGAEVVAIDLSAQLVDLARQRIATLPDAQRLLQRIHLCSGDMMDAGLGEFDHVVAMDSIIHYDMVQAVHLVGVWAPRTRGSISITFAPRNPLLVLMRAAGRLFPRANRAPWIEPFSERQLRQSLMQAPALIAWEATRTQRISSGFYTSQALMLERGGTR